MILRLNSQPCRHSGVDSMVQIIYNMKLCSNTGIAVEQLHADPCHICHIYHPRVAQELVPCIGGSRLQDTVLCEGRTHHSALSESVEKKLLLECEVLNALKVCCLSGS